MAILRRTSFPRQWNPTTVPTWPVELDTTHPLAQGLVACYAPGSRAGLVDLCNNGPQLTSNGGLITNGSTGPGARDGSGYGGFSSTAIPAALQLGGSLSVFAAGAFSGPSLGGVNPTIFGIVLGGSPYLSYGFTLIGNGSTANIRFFGSPGGNATFATSPGYSASIAGPTSLLGTYNGSAMTLYQGGSSVNSVGASGSMSYSPGPTSFQIGELPANARSANFLLTAGLIYNRALPTSQAQWLNAEPFAMLRPIIRRQYYTAATGNTPGIISATVTGTSNATATLTGHGTLTTAATGTSTTTAALTAHGTLSAAPAATSTTSATITGAGTLSASALASSAASATLHGFGPISGVVTAGTSTASATLTGNGALSARAAGVSAASAALAGAGHIAATAASTSALTATLVGGTQPKPTVIAIAVSPMVRVQPVSAMARIAEAPTVSTTTPIRLPSMIQGSTDTRGIDAFPALQIEGDTVASIGGITVTRRDGTTIGTGDLTITPSGFASPWLSASGNTLASGALTVINWWQDVGDEIAAAGNVDYQLQVAFTTTAGRPLTYTCYQLASPTLG